MKTEQQIKSQVTPDIIKKMCELAEGFEIKNCHVCLDLWYIHIDNIKDDFLIFPLLIYRAVEGINKLKRDYINCAIILYSEELLLARDIITDKCYEFKDYQPSTLTACELACLDCLCEVL